MQGTLTKGIGLVLILLSTYAESQPASWRAYCIEENKHLGGFYRNSSDASIVASSHNIDTGHSTRFYEIQPHTPAPSAAPTPQAPPPPDLEPTVGSLIVDEGDVRRASLSIGASKDARIHNPPCGLGADSRCMRTCVSPPQGMVFTNVVFFIKDADNFGCPDYRNYVHCPSKAGADCGWATLKDVRIGAGEICVTFKNWKTVVKCGKISAAFKKGDSRTAAIPKSDVQELTY